MSETPISSQQDAAVADGTPVARVISISERAAGRVTELLTAESNPALLLRAFVAGGGCSGFQYGFTFDDTINEDDQVFERGDVRVVIDEASLDLLAGSEIDWVEDLAGAAFQIRNPNATASCGCGASFSV